MNGSKFDTIFEDFIKRLVLTKTQKNRIDTTLSTARTIFDDIDVRMQGSFATGTTTKPLTEHTSKNGKAGEYDADIALLSRNWEADSVEALNITRSVLTSSNNALTIRSKNGLYDLTENLVEKVTDKDKILALLSSFKKALLNMSVDTLEDMQLLLSIEFPTDKNQFPIEMQSLRANELAYDTKNGLSEYEIRTSDHSNHFYKLITRGMEFVNPVKIKFTVSNHRELNSDRDLAARWRITNDPAKIPEDVRGGLLSRSSGNEFVHTNETAKYDGMHRAEVFMTERGSNKVIGAGKYKVKKVANL